jgi:Tfp pilus assembly protein PilF
MFVSPAFITVSKIARKRVSKRRGRSSCSDGDNQQAKDLNNEAVALMQQNEWKKAEAALRGAIELDPKVALFHYNLGNLYMKWHGGHPNGGSVYNDMGLEAYRGAKALAPRNLAIRQNIGAYLCQHHYYDEAIAEFREMLKMGPSWNMARPCLYESLSIRTEGTKLARC